MHEQALKLEALWRQDQERDQLLRERRGLDERLKHARAGLADAEQRVTSAQAHLDALSRDEKEHTSKLNNYIKHRDQAQRMIDEGRAPDYAVAMAQVSRCSNGIDQEEDILLALFDKIDGAKAELEAANNARGLMALRVKEADEARAAHAPDLDERLKAATVAVQAARVGVEREHLSRYDILRGKGVAPFADVRDGACTGCNVKLNSLMVSEHRRGVIVATCSSCGRFLGALA